MRISRRGRIIPDRKMWDEATPFVKGYWSYTYAQWPNSTIPDVCPFASGTKEHEQYHKGQRIAAEDAQDNEED